MNEKEYLMMKRRWIWTLAVAALFCSCSVSEDLEMEVPSADDCILEVAVGLDDGGKTRGLSGDASSITATWQAGDKVLVYKDNTKVGELTPVSTGSASTTLRGKLSGTYDSYAAGSTLTLYYNTTSTSFSSFTQDGTLATILANLRYQSATTTVSKASDRPTLTGTTVTFNLAADNPSINHFTLSKEMKTLRVSAQGSTTLLASATADSPTTDFYVAIPAAASQTYLIEGISEYPYCEYFQAKTAALSANKYYSASVNLTENPLTFEPVSATTTVTINISENFNHLPDEIEYSDDDGVTWKQIGYAHISQSTTWTVEAGQRLMVRFLWNMPPDSYNSMFYGNCFIVDQPCYVYGNIGSLLDVDADAATNYINCFYGSFSGQINIRSHPFRRLVIGLWGTSQVRFMNNMFSGMFSGCSGLTEAPVLNFSNWNTSNVQYMDNMFSSMFSGCSNLTTAPVLDLSYWDTSHVKGMNSMFYSMFSGCSSLTTAPVLDFSNWETIDVEDMGNMFDSMFSGCTSLTTGPVLDLSNWYTSSVTNISNMFNGMFSGCTSLTTAPVLSPNFDTSSVTNMSNMFNSMFSGCSSLITAPDLNISSYSFSHDNNTEDMFSNMFSGCTSLTTGPVLDFSNWNVPSNGTGLYVMFKSMFDGCGNLNAVTMKLENTTILGETSRFTDFLTGAKATGTLTVSSGTTSYWNAIKTAGYIPSGWTITEQ